MPAPLQALTIKQRAKPTKTVVAKRLTKVGRQFVELMVWEGMNRVQAATKLGISASWSYSLLASPTVNDYMRQQLDVRRKGEAPRNLARLTELRDQDENKAAAVSAIKVLEQITDEATRAGGADRNLMPGFIVRVNVNNGPVSPRVGETIDAKPLIEHASAVNDQLSVGLDDVYWIDGTGEGEG